jgi:DNA invertase Pin-like site-specific DNA recombinase
MVAGQGGEWVVYLRLSKGRAGIARQRRATIAWVEGDLGGTIVDEFRDADKTAFQQFGGPLPKRAGFDGMLAAIAARPGLSAAAWHADRLCRNLDDAERLLTTSAGAGGVIGTPAGGIYDPSTATGRGNFRRDVVSAISEVDHMTERIVLMKNEAKAAGHWLGGPRPFGWERDRSREDGEPPRLLLAPAEADLIRSGTLAIIEGASLRSVAAAWNASGITGPRGGTWANRDVSLMLRRARNAGLAEHNLDGTGPQVLRDGTWPALVTADEWRTCKAVLENPARRTAFTTQPKHLLSGIALCGVCGSPVVADGGNRGRGRPRQVTYRDRPKGGKGHVARNAGPLEEYVSELVIAWVERYGQDALNPPAPDTALLSAQLRAVEGELRSLERAADEGAITNAQWLRRVTPLNKQAASLGGRIASAAVARVPAQVFTEDDIRAGWHAADLDAQRAIIRALMTITILPSPPGRPPGWKRGDGPYFRPELVRIGWKRGGGDPAD